MTYEWPLNTWIDFDERPHPLIIDTFIPRPAPPPNCLPCFRSFQGEGARWPEWVPEEWNGLM